MLVRVKVNREYGARSAAHMYSQRDLTGYHNVVIFFPGHPVFDFAFYTLHIINEISRCEGVLPYLADLEWNFR